MSEYSEKWRQIFLVLIRDLEYNYVRREAYRAVIQSSLDQGLPIREDWEEVVEQIVTDPNFKERVAPKFARLYDFALRDLDEKSAQELLDRVHNFVNDIQ